VRGSQFHGLLYRKLPRPQKNSDAFSGTLRLAHCPNHRNARQFALSAATMNTLLLIIVLLLLFGGGGFYFGGPAIGGGGLGLVLLIVLIIYLMGGLRGPR